MFPHMKHKENKILGKKERKKWGEENTSSLFRGWMKMKAKQVERRKI